MTYETFFGLREKPFGLSSDPRFLFHSASHAATYEDLLGGIRRREGLLVLTGEIGTGKTTLCRAVLQSLGRKTFSSFVPDPFVSREDLLKMLLIDFGVTSIQELTTGDLKHATRTELSYLLAGFLESLALDAFAVVVVDEAQNMSLPLIEETRILADSFGGKGSLQIVFVGQPELLGKLKLPEMRQVDQRVCGYTHLSPLTPDAVAGYVQHRLYVAGGSRERVLFPPDVVELLHQRSGGVPRLINRLCDRALYVAHLRQLPVVDREVMTVALHDIGATTLSPTWDSIVYNGAPAPAPAPGDAPAAAAAATTLEPVEDEQRGSATALMSPFGFHEVEIEAEGEEMFSRRIDEWLSTQDRTPAAAHKPPSLEDFASDADAPASSSPAHAAAPRRVAFMPGWRSKRREPRSETYMQRLARTWARRASIAAGCAIALNAAVVSASHLSSRWAGSAELPEPPVLPVLEVPLVSAPAFPELPELPREAPARAVPAATPAPQAVATGDFFVTVGLFGNPDGASRLVQQLSAAGMPVKERPYQLNGRTVQQVLVGPFARRADATDALARLREQGGFDDARVVSGN